MALLDPASPWQPPRSETITLWHGCTDNDRVGIEERGIELKLGRVDVDFGRGFYTTTREQQAKHWAVRRFDSRFVKKARNSPVVLRFNVSRRQLGELTNLSFIVGDDEDFWSLVQHCRKSRNKRGDQPGIVHDHGGPVSEGGFNWFDLVSGPVVAGWDQRALMKDRDQYSFHTQRAVDVLNALVVVGKTEHYSWQTVGTQ